MNRKKQLYQIAVRKNTLRMKWETLETDLGLSQPSVRIGIRSALIALFARHRLHIVDLGQQQFSSCQYMFFPVVDVVCFCPAYGLFFYFDCVVVFSCCQCFDGFYLVAVTCSLHTQILSFGFTDLLWSVTCYSLLLYPPLFLILCLRNIFYLCIAVPRCAKYALLCMRWMRMLGVYHISASVSLGFTGLQGNKLSKLCQQGFLKHFGCVVCCMYMKR